MARRRGRVGLTSTSGQKKPNITTQNTGVATRQYRPSAQRRSVLRRDDLERLRGADPGVVDRAAAGLLVAGEALAKRFGWKVGDTIPLQATIFPQKDGSNAWQVKLMGTFAMKDAKRRGMAVHGRRGQACPVCGDEVRSVFFADNSLEYCPTCQTGGKLLADRRLSRLLK